MTRSKGSDHPVARRVAMASMTVLAASGIGLVAAPMAFGQILIPLGSSQSTGVTNSGSAGANSGGNTAVGNASTNTATSTTDASEGGLIALPITLGAPTNTSDGNAAVSTGPSTALGSSAQTTVGQSQASGNRVNSFLAGQRQAADVTNAGSASANSGGNVAVGNASQNTATVNDVRGGLLGVGVTLGGPTNNSTGTAAINSGAANAVGNNSGTNVGQSSLQGVGGAGVGAGPCGTGRFGSIQHVEVLNQGQAEANTGDNVAVGNASTNDASTTQTVSGGLLGLGLTIGGPVNNSSGTAVINTGPATAVGNNSVTQVGQTEGCPQVTTLTAAPGVVVPGAKVDTVRDATLARTGLDTGDIGMVAGALLAAGMLLVASQRRRMVARSAADPMAGFGFGVGDIDWDGPVR